MPTAAARRAVKELASLIEAHANRTRAIGEQAYLKSDLEFFGADLPTIRRTARAWAKEHAPLTHDLLVDVVTLLWSSRVHELHSIAIELLEDQRQLLVADDAALLERLIRTSFTWAYVDPLSGVVMAGLVKRFPELNETLERWSTDEDFWIRRSSMLALLGPIRAGGGDFQRFARYADAMLEEREFFIRKAIGWVLREASKKRPALVADRMRPRAHRASGVTVREAVKYLDPVDREAIMAAYSGASRSTRS